MYVNNAERARPQTGLYEIIVLGQVLLNNRPAFDVVREELPAHGEPERIEPVVIDEMLHLAFAICAIVLCERRPGCTCSAGSVAVATKVEPCDVDASEFEFTGGDWWGTGIVNLPHPLPHSTAGCRGVPLHGTAFLSGTMTYRTWQAAVLNVIQRYHRGTMTYRIYPTAVLNAIQRVSLLFSGSEYCERRNTMNEEGIFNDEELNDGLQ